MKQIAKTMNFWGVVFLAFFLFGFGSATLGQTGSAQGKSPNENSPTLVTREIVKAKLEELMSIAGKLFPGESFLGEDVFYPLLGPIASPGTVAGAFHQLPFVLQAQELSPLGLGHLNAQSQALLAQFGVQLSLCHGVLSSPTQVEEVSVRGLVWTSQALGGVFFSPLGMWSGASQAASAKAVPAPSCPYLPSDDELCNCNEDQKYVQAIFCALEHYAEACDAFQDTFGGDFEAADAAYLADLANCLGEKTGKDDKAIGDQIFQTGVGILAGAIGGPVGAAAGGAGSFAKTIPSTEDKLDQNADEFSSCLQAAGDKFDQAFQDALDHAGAVFTDTLVAACCVDCKIEEQKTGDGKK